MTKKESRKMKNKYFVNVGNVGSLEYINRREAIKAFKDYVKLSKDSYGRAGGENVCLFVNGEPESDYDFNHGLWQIGKIDKQIINLKNKIIDLTNSKKMLIAEFDEI